MIQAHPGRVLVAAVVLVVWGLITHSTHAGTGDEPHYLVIAHSLAFDRDLDLANNYRDASLVMGGAWEPEFHARFHEGRLRPVHDIGLPLLFAPAVRLVYPVAETLAAVLPSSWLQAAKLDGRLLLRHQVSLLMAFVAGLLARELFLLFRDLGGSPRHAFWWALLFVLSPPILSHAYLFVTEVPAALVALFVFRRLSVRPAAGGTELRPVVALVLGALTGLLLLIHARNIGLVAGLSALALLAVRRRTMPAAAGAAFVLGLTAGVVARTLVTYTLWGTLLTTPHASFGGTVPITQTIQETFISITGLMADREHGLLAYAPIYLLAAAGFTALARRDASVARDTGLVLAACLVPILLPQTNVHGWRGGWSPAARFLMPVVPLLCLAAYAYVLAGTRTVVVALVALQVAINAYVWQVPKTLWNGGTGETAFAAARWLPTWHEPTLVQHLLFGAVLCAVVAFGYAQSGAGLTRRREDHEGLTRSHGATKRRPRRRPEQAD